jgi:hypothetical protein
MVAINPMISLENSVNEETKRKNSLDLHRNGEEPRDPLEYKQRIREVEKAAGNKRTNYSRSYQPDLHVLRGDFSHNIPWKRKERTNLPSGLYGYTFLLLPQMWVNDNLIPGSDMDRKTDIHESIHTPDELETRYLVQWMLNEFFVHPYEKVREPYYN